MHLWNSNIDTMPKKRVKNGGCRLKNRIPLRYCIDTHGENFNDFKALFEVFFLND